MPHQLFGDDRVRSHHRLHRVRNFPRDFRHVLRDAAENFSIEILDDLRPPLVPPDLRRGDSPAALQCEWIRKIRKRIRFRFVVVGGPRVGFGHAAARRRPKPSDAELLHHILMIFSRRPVLGFGQLRRPLLRDKGCSHQDQDCQRK